MCVCVCICLCVRPYAAGSLFRRGQSSTWGAGYDVCCNRSVLFGKVLKGFGGCTEAYSQANTPDVPERLCFPCIALSAMHAARIVAANRVRTSQYLGGYWLLAWISAALGAILVSVMVLLLCCKNRPVGSSKPRKRSTADDVEPNLEPRKDFGATPSPWAAGSTGGLCSATHASKNIPSFDPLQKYGSCRAAQDIPAGHPLQRFGSCRAALDTKAFDPVQKFGSCRVNNLLYDFDCTINSDDGDSGLQDEEFSHQDRRQGKCAEDGLSCWHGLVLPQRM